MPRMSHELALEIAIDALQPHFSTELTASTPISAGLKQLDDGRLRAISEDTEDLARNKGYLIHLSFSKLKSGSYLRVINYSDDIWVHSDKSPSTGDFPSAKLSK